MKTRDFPLFEGVLMIFSLTNFLSGRLQLYLWQVQAPMATKLKTATINSIGRFLTNYNVTKVEETSWTYFFLVKTSKPLLCTLISHRHFTHFYSANVHVTFQTLAQQHVHHCWFHFWIPLKSIQFYGYKFVNFLLMEVAYEELWIWS